MKRRIPKPENLAKLTPEQLEIYNNWEKESEQCDIIFQEILNALGANNLDEVKRLGEKIQEVIPAVCEHGKSVFGSCQACDEIERTVFPEFFDANGERIDDVLGECVITTHLDPSLN